MVRVTYKSALDYSISSPHEERADEAGIFRIVRAADSSTPMRRICSGCWACATKFSFA